MRQFLKNIVLFSVTVIIVITSFQLVISYRISEKAVNGYDNWDSLSNQNAELLLLGSSRCWVHFDPAFFEKEYRVKTINLGMNGHSELTAIQLRLKNYLAKNKKPKYVILSFDAFVKPGDFENNTNFTDKNKYARFAFFPSEENQKLVNYFKFTPTEKYVPLYALFKYRLLEDCTRLNKTNNFKEGYGQNNDRWDTIKYPVSDEVKKFFIKDYEYIALKKQLKDFNQYCKQNKIKMLCIQTPIYKILSNHKKFKQTITLCKSLNIPIIDANYTNVSMEIKHFYNSNHLNKKGVVQMNKLLKEEKELNRFFKINP